MRNTLGGDLLMTSVDGRDHYSEQNLFYCSDSQLTVHLGQT